MTKTQTQTPRKPISDEVIEFYEKVMKRLNAEIARFDDEILRLTYERNGLIKAKKLAETQEEND